MKRPGDRVRTLALGTLGGTLLAFFALTVGALLFTVPLGAVPRLVRDPLVAEALLVSLATSTLSMFLVVTLGTPLAWLLARGRGRFASGLELALQLPEAIPPAVAGLALLLAFGRQGLLGAPLAALGIGVAFTPTAVVFAQVFVGGPFFVQAAIAAFRRVDEELLGVSRSLGAGPFATFLRVTLPMSAPALCGGLGLAWARALGEFGATLMFAGNLSGRTQTLPLAVYAALESDLATAQITAVVLLVIAVTLLVVVRVLGGRDRSSARALPLHNEAAT
ncbi:MAG TPA: ABC transporter permease [Polyangia bacterium]